MKNNKQQNSIALTFYVFSVLMLIIMVFEIYLAHRQVSEAMTNYSLSFADEWMTFIFGYYCSAQVILPLSTAVICYGIGYMITMFQEAKDAFDSKFDRIGDKNKSKNAKQKQESKPAKVDTKPVVTENTETVKDVKAEENKEVKPQADQPKEAAQKENQPQNDKAKENKENKAQNNKGKQEQAKEAKPKQPKKPNTNKPNKEKQQEEKPKAKVEEQKQADKPKTEAKAEGKPKAEEPTKKESTK